MKKTLILIVLIITLIIVAIGWLSWKGFKTKEEANVITYKTEYNKGENLKIKIDNNSKEQICFSSCYPYYLERNNGGFKSYQYDNCPKDDIVETCLNPDEIKAFELILDKMEINGGLHRVAIPACVGCAINEHFRKDKWFYSNEFNIK